MNDISYNMQAKGTTIVSDINAIKYYQIIDLCRALAALISAISFRVFFLWQFLQSVCKLDKLQYDISRGANANGTI